MLAQADQVQELDRYEKWKLSIRDVPVVVPKDYVAPDYEAERPFHPYYHILLLQDPKGKVHELPITNKNLLIRGEDPVDYFFEISSDQKPHFTGDWNQDGIPEILLQISLAMLSMKSGKNGPSDDGTTEYILSFAKGHFSIIGTFNFFSGLALDEYAVTIPQTKGSWPILDLWANNEVAKPKILEWKVDRYLYNGTKYQKNITWDVKGYTKKEQILQKFDLNELQTNHHPLASLWDDKVFLRKEANRSSDSLGLLSRNTLLYLLSMTGPSVTIDNYHGPWLKVLVLTGALKGQEGWVFGGFVVPYNFKIIEAKAFLLI